MAEATTATASRAPAEPSYPWVLIGLLWLVAFLNAADRNILIAVLSDLKTEFGLTNSQLALLGSVFFWVYAVGAFIAGRIGDSVRRTRVILYRPDLLERGDRHVGARDRLRVAARDARPRRRWRVGLLSDRHRADRRLAQAGNAQPGAVDPSNRRVRRRRARRGGDRLHRRAAGAGMRRS